MGLPGAKKGKNDSEGARRPSPKEKQGEVEGRKEPEGNVGRLVAGESRGSRWTEKAKRGPEGGP